MSALPIDSVLVEEKNLYVPTLEEVQKALKESLPKNFENVTVEVIDCPNLKSSPFNLADAGLSGSTKLVEGGGPPYLLPLVDRTKVYDIKKLLQKLFQDKNLNSIKKNIFAIGAGAGPNHLRNTNCEGAYNFQIKPDNTFCSESWSHRVDGPKELCVAEKIPNEDTRIPILFNLYACEGKPGKVLRVHCKKRIGEQNFIESIRLGLENHFKEKSVGLGGIFLLKNGTVRNHVMRDFSKVPINTEEELNTWLKFYEIPPVLNAVGTLITRDCDLDLRLQHFHTFSTSNWGGHYHYDITPDTVEYEGFFNIAEKIIRIDKPVNTHQFGRD